MIDRYTKFILTVIAGALLYLAAIFTPLPSASAQTPSRFPGQSSGPTEVVVVGWQTSQAIVPVSIGTPGAGDGIPAAPRHYRALVRYRRSSSSCWLGRECRSRQGRQDGAIQR